MGIQLGVRVPDNASDPTVASLALMTSGKVAGAWQPRPRRDGIETKAVAQALESSFGGAVLSGARVHRHTASTEACREPANFS